MTSRNASDTPASGGGAHQAETDLEVEGVAGPDGLATGDRMYLVVRDQDRARVLDLRDGDIVTIGRGAEATIVVDDSRISRQHARIRRAGGVLIVEDLRSR